MYYALSPLYMTCIHLCLVCTDVTHVCNNCYIVYTSLQRNYAFYVPGSKSHIRWGSFLPWISQYTCICKTYNNKYLRKPPTELPTNNINLPALCPFYLKARSVIQCYNCNCKKVIYCQTHWPILQQFFIFTTVLHMGDSFHHDCYCVKTFDIFVWCEFNKNCLHYSSVSLALGLQKVNIFVWSSSILIRSVRSLTRYRQEQHQIVKWR